ncbi:MAG: hypothetical protein LBJ14_04685 [Desulfarculales bacterium]|jgi:hypothetical protein|nr:hypothetical protein [Desulfarculales bacterium]
MKIAAVLIFSAFTFIASPLSAAPLLAVGGGENANPNLALSQAGLDAQNQALGRQIMERLDDEKLKRDFSALARNILSRPGTYIKSSRLLSHWREGDVTKVLAEVEIDGPALEAALGNLSGPEIPDASAPEARVLCLVSEKVAPGRPALYWRPDPEGQAAPPVIEKALRAIGYVPYLPAPVSRMQAALPAAGRAGLSPEQALLWGRKFEAGLLLIGQVRLYPRSDAGEGGEPVVSLSLLRANENKILAQVEAQGPLFRPGSGDETELAIEREISEAVLKLFELAGLRVAALPPARIRLEYQGLSSAAQAVRLERLLTLLGGAVSSVRRESMSQGRAVFILDSQIGGVELAERMRALPELTATVKIVEQSESSLILAPAGK